MDEQLQRLIYELMTIADRRNLSSRNPVAITLSSPSGEGIYVVVSVKEPNNATLPLNVLWAVVDSESENYGKLLRRTTLAPSTSYRNTWSEVTTYEDVYAQWPVWDTTDTFSLGEVEVPEVGAATKETRGLVSLNRTYTPDPSNPIVVASTDVRMSNPRIPLPHTHVKQPITMMRVSTGVNEAYTVFTSSNPVAGQILCLDSEIEPGIWSALWRFPTVADLQYDGPVPATVAIKGPTDNTLDETLSFQFTADVTFDDSSVVSNAPVVWEIISGSQYGTIGTDSGNFTSLDIDSDQTIRVKATYTHMESGVVVSETSDVTIVDNTVTINLVSIEILGPDTANENTTVYYSVNATYSDGTTTGVTPDTFSSSNPGSGTFNSTSGSLIVPELTEDQTTTLTASYTFNGSTETASLDVTTLDNTIYPESAAIVGASVVDENTTSNYALRVTFSDSSTQDYTELSWLSSNEAVATIDGNGNLTAVESVTQDLTTNVSTSFTLNGRTVSATRMVTIHDTTIYPRSATIQGASTVNEGSNTQYQFVVTFTDDSTLVVSVDDWMLDNNEAGSIDATTGMLTAPTDVDGDVSGNITATYTADGETVAASKLVTVSDTTTYPSSATILGNASMDEGTSQTMSLEVTYTDGSTSVVVVDNWSVDSEVNASIGVTSGVLMAANNVKGNKTVVVSASHTSEGRTVSDTFTVTVRDVTNYPVSAVVTGPSYVDEDTTQTYALTVTFNDGSTSDVVASSWEVTAPATIDLSGDVTSPSVTEDTSVTITGTYTLDGDTVTANKTITLRDKTIYPESAIVLGASSVNESSTSQYSLQVTYSDASVANVSVNNWASDNNTAGTINQNTGLFTASSVDSEETTRLSASYTSEGRTVSAFKDVVVQDVTIYPVSASIQGSNTVDEGAAENYALSVTYSDGSTSNVPATWANSNTQAGVINTSSGRFVAVSETSTNVTTTISASYTSEGATVTDNIEVTVLDITAYPSSATIQGPNTVDESTQETYTMRVTFDDGSSTLVTADSWTSSNNAAGSIDSSGVFTAASNDTDSNITTTLTAVYTLEGREVTATKTIGVVDTTNYPQTLVVSGPTQVYSSDESGAVTYAYTATVTYRDGSSSSVTGENWSVLGSSVNDDVGTIDSTGNFTTNPDATGSNRTITISAGHTELGKSLTSSQTATFNVVPRPASLTISGPTEVQSQSTTVYVANATLTNGTSSEVTPTWSVNDTSIATITSNGELVSKEPSSDSNVIITATYEDNGVTVTDTHTVTVKRLVRVSSISASGPTEVPSGQTAVYSVVATYDDASTATITNSVIYSSSNVSAGSFDSTNKGNFNAANVSSDEATTLTFSYTYNGDTVTDTISLNVAAPVVLASNKPRWGQAMFADTDFTGGPEGETDINYDIPYEQWDDVQDFADSVMTNLMETEGTEIFSFTLGNAQYGYFMHLKSLSAKATFTDQANGFPGGWDGATWTPEGEMGTVYDPIEVQYDCGDGNGPQAWLIYRTDWDSLGSMSYEIEY